MIFKILIANLAWFSACVAAEVDPPLGDVEGPKPAVAAADKPKGPEHNVTLTEEPAVLDLFARAAKARARAEKDPEVWPECVKCYAEILRKYPDTVYLDRWEQADKSDMAYKNGLYKSTRERVAREIAALPPAALAVYRVVNDPAARALYADAREQFDERKMEQVMRDYSSTSWGDDAAAWLAAAALDRGAPRYALARLTQLAGKQARGRATGSDIAASATGILSQMLLAQLQLGDRSGAEKALRELESAANNPENGALRAGHNEGPAALAGLRVRVEKMPAGSAGVPPAGALAGGTPVLPGWTTYFGNATHTQIASPRPNIGLRKWSLKISDLLYGLNSESPATERITLEVPQNGGLPAPVEAPTINQHLTVQESIFYLCDAQSVVSYPVSNPAPGSATVPGNARFLWPSDGTKGGKQKAARNQSYMLPAVRHHPYFCTLAGRYCFAAMGPEPNAAYVNINRWRGGFVVGGRGRGNGEEKPPTNYLVGLRTTALDKDGLAGVEELWSLKTGAPAFQGQNAADQEWLRSVYIVSAPTYDAGALYVSAVLLGGSNDAWAAAFDALTGRLLWRTLICTSPPVAVNALVQPDLGLPVAVSGGVVFVTTNLGAVAALDASSGAVKWIRVYDRIKGLDANWNGGGAPSANRDFWGPNPPLVYENLVIVTPQDGDMLWAYDIETGARVYELDRNKEGAGKGLKHVAGIVNGVLVLTGADIRFYKAKSGSLALDPITPPAEIRGRGTISGNMVLVSTEKGLLRIDTGAENGRFFAKLHDEQKWAEPAVEAGNVFVAGDVLYTVSHTHVNAYFVWEEVEARLKERVKATPADLAAYVELADIYRGIERFDQALAALDAGLSAARNLKGAPPESAEGVAAIYGKKFEIYMSLAEIEKAAKRTAQAREYFDKAYEAALQPGLSPSLPVMALRAMSDQAVAQGDLSGAVKLLQKMIVKHGDAVFSFQPQTTLKARLYAQNRISELKVKDPQCYFIVEAEAAAELGATEARPDRLEAILANYPNAEACEPALFSLAQLNLKSRPDRARQYCQRLLTSRPASRLAAPATALLAVAFENLQLLSPAKTVLRRLQTRPQFADAAIPANLLDPKGAGGEIKAAEWAQVRLEGALYKTTASAAVNSLGNGKLKEAWSKSSDELTIPLNIDGLAPAEMRGNVFYLENQTELAVYAGRDGAELWRPRPTPPANCTARAAWSENLLLVFGGKEIVAYDSKDNGKVVWRYELKSKLGVAAPYWCSVSGGRLAVFHSGNSLNVLDASSGAELWQTKAEGAQVVGNPACGDGFIALAVTNAPKLLLYDLDTGAVRAEVDVPSGYQVAPVACGDCAYIASRDGHLSAVDGLSGKRIWDEQISGAVTTLQADSELVLALINRKQIIAFNAGTGATGSDVAASGTRKAWWIVLPADPKYRGEPAIIDFLHDGDDLYVAATLPPGRGALLAYSVPAQGKFLWQQEMASEQSQRAQPFGPGQPRIIIQGQGQLIINGVVIQAGQGIPNDAASAQLLDDSIAREHVVIAQSNWDPTGFRATAVVAVDRKTGKLTWDANLRSELSQDGTSRVTYNLLLFDGGVMVGEGRTRTAYVAPAPSQNEADEMSALGAKLKNNPKDVAAKIGLWLLQFHAGLDETALDGLAVMLDDPALNEEEFNNVYTQLSLLRREVALKHDMSESFTAPERQLRQKRVLSFKRMEKAPPLNGDPAAWAGILENVYDSWRDVYLPSELDTRTPPKKGSWKGRDDLSVSFRGAYDDKNLYMLFVVTDDVHKNEQPEGSYSDLGDSLKLAFDIDLDGGMGYRGEDFELGLSLNKAGAAQGWRWVEHGRYLRGQTPLEKGFIVVRKEAEHQTIYQLELPLEYLGLKAEAGRKFGFSFAVHDQDAGQTVEKSIAASPGVMRPPYPGMFLQAVLEAKK